MPTEQEKSQARSQVTTALNRKQLSRQPCEVCGAEKAEAHHEDYSRPLDVRWLCFSCHRTHHHLNGPKRSPNAHARSFFAIENPYGTTALNRNGSRANVLHAFDSITARDQFIARDPAHREATRASSATVRRLIRHPSTTWETDDDGRAIIRFMDR